MPVGKPTHPKPFTTHAVPASQPRLSADAIKGSPQRDPRKDRASDRPARDNTANPRADRTGRATRADRGDRSSSFVQRPRRCFGESIDTTLPDTVIRHNRLRQVLRALRPQQWIKNFLLLGAMFFAYFDSQQLSDLRGSEDLWVILLCAAVRGIAAFSLLSSAVYLMNDIHDRAADQNHPQKKLRPIASGDVTVPCAVGTIAALLLCTLLVSFGLEPRFGILLGIYALMQIAYTFFLKRIELLDVFIVAAGFVLRAVAGAVLINVRISPWLLLCVFLLSLFVALCKRRHDALILSQSTLKTFTQAPRPPARPGGPAWPGLITLEPEAAVQTSLRDLEIAIAASSVIVCYAAYTLSPDTVARFGTEHLVYSVPFVLFAVLRYVRLAYKTDLGGRPERVFLTDRVMLGTIAAWLLICFLIFYYHR